MDVASSGSSLEYFLTQCVRSPEDDKQWGVGWWVLDAESIHNDILQILLSNSQEFAKALLEAEGRCFRPTRDFDLQVKLANGDMACIEIEVWSDWGRTQREKQIRLIRENAPAKGFAILLANSAAQSKQSVHDETEGMFTKISYSKLDSALDAVRGGDAVREIATAYRVALKQHEHRIRKRYDWDPDA